MITTTDSRKNRHSDDKGNSKMPISSSRNERKKALRKASTLVKGSGDLVNKLERIEQIVSSPTDILIYFDKDGNKQEQGLVRLDTANELINGLSESLIKRRRARGLTEIARALPANLDTKLRTSLESLQHALAVSRRLSNVDLKVNSDHAYRLAPGLEEQALKKGSIDRILWQTVNATRIAVKDAESALERVKSSSNQEQIRSVKASLVECHKDLSFIEEWLTLPAQSRETVNAGMNPQDRPDLLKVSSEIIESLENNYPIINELSPLSELRDLTEIKKELFIEIRKMDTASVYGRKDAVSETPWEGGIIRDRLAGLSEKFKELPIQILETYSLLNSLRNRKGFSDREEAKKAELVKLHEIVEPDDRKKSGAVKFHGRIHGVISDLIVLLRDRRTNDKLSTTQDLLAKLNSMIQTRKPEAVDGIIRSKDIQKIINSIHQLEDIAAMPAAIDLREEINQAKAGLVQVLPKGVEVTRKRTTSLLPIEIEELLSGIEEAVRQENYSNLGTKIEQLARLNSRNALSMNAANHLHQRITSMDSVLRNKPEKPPRSILQSVLGFKNILREALKERQGTKQKISPGTPSLKPVKEINKSSGRLPTAEKLVSNFSNYIKRLFDATTQKLQKALRAIPISLHNIVKTVRRETSLANETLPKLRRARLDFLNEHKSELGNKAVIKIQEDFNQAIQKITTLVS